MSRPRLLLALVACAAAVRADGPWPFGGGARGLDLYNLGLLGAKAADAETRPAVNEPPQEGRREVQLEAAGKDVGPERLRIDLLFPDGPAARAGLHPGDVIVGVGSRRFSKGSLEPLAKALLKAESTKGVVALLVQSGGSGAPRKVEVSIPVSPAGKDAAKPTTGKGRAELWKGGLAWLAERQQEDGGYPETLSGSNGAVILTSLAGLAWLGGPADQYRDNVSKAARFVIERVAGLREADGGPQGGANWNQSNWGHAHAAIFLGELHARSPDRGVLDALQLCAKQLVAAQEKSGGWAHGPGGPNALGYVELNIVTGLALSGLGLARQAGYEVPPATLARAEEYLVASSSGDGGVGYSTAAGQQGQGNIGRTAASWLGYLALGLGKKPWARKMGAYVQRHADEVLGGHASLMQHYLLAGVAAQFEGKTATKRYWEFAERDLVLARAPDGSFQPRPWHESLGMGSNSDVTFGDVWTTAAWTIVLVSEPSRDGAVGFPAWSGAR